MRLSVCVGVPGMLLELSSEEYVKDKGGLPGGGVVSEIRGYPQMLVDQYRSYSSSGTELPCRAQSLSATPDEDYNFYLRLVQPEGELSHREFVGLKVKNEYAEEGQELGFVLTITMDELHQLMKLIMDYFTD